MTQHLPPQMEGQIKAPNPIELFWERHRRKLNFAVTALVLVMLGVYAYGFWRQSQINSLWSGIARATKLDEGYTTEGSAKQFLREEQQQQQGEWMKQIYYGMTQDELVSRLREQFKNASKKDLDEQIARVRGSSVEAYLLWVAANRAYALGEWESCRSLLKDLQNRFPNHLLCQSTDYPVQWRYDRNVDKEKPKGPDASRAKREDPDLVPPVRGSEVALLLEQLDKVEAFRKAEESRFYKVPEPDASPTYVIKTSNGDIHIRLYKSLAPKHCENFAARVKENFFDGMHIDEIHRPAPKSAFSPDDGQEFRFGLASSKDADRSRWISTEPSRFKLDWEHNDLSHFPGMVAADKESDNKMSSGDRIWINANDCYQKDGDRVIFGRVVQGLEIVQQLVQEQFSTQQEAKDGRGKPSRNIRIESVREQQ